MAATRTFGLIALSSAAIGFAPAAQAQSKAPADSALPVTIDNFAVAESDLYFGNAVKAAGGIGTFFHSRTPTEIDKQLVIRMNRDTLYSSAVFDLDAGPATLTLPDAGKRFMSLQIISEDHYAPMVVYAPTQVTLTKANVGTRYAMAAVRTLVDPNNPDDLKDVAALQDAIKVSQPGGPGKFEVANWNTRQQKEIRDALLVLAKYSGGFDNAAGPRGAVDPIRHLIVTAAGWGANPDKDARYASATPEKNDGTTIYKLGVPANVPVDGFWSITLYNGDGYLQKNAYDAYSVNNITAKKAPDGAVNVQFGGCDGKIPNCLPIMPGWNYTVRMYRPRPEILDGKWTFPRAVAVE